MFLLFAGEQYYPSGGWQDFVGSYSTIEEAIMIAVKTRCDWWHIVDLDSQKIVLYNYVKEKP